MSTSGRRSLGLRGHLHPWDLTGDLEPDDLGDRPPGVWAGIAGAFAPSGDRLLAVVGGVGARPGMPMSLAQKDHGTMRLRSHWMGVRPAAGRRTCQQDRAQARRTGARCGICLYCARRPVVFWRNLSPGGAPCPILLSSTANMET